jgi:hypothetical protein
MQQTNRWEAGQTLEGDVLPPIEILLPNYGHIYIISFDPLPSKKNMG